MIVFQVYGYFGDFFVSGEGDSITELIESLRIIDDSNEVGTFDSLPQQVQMDVLVAAGVDESDACYYLEAV